MGKVTNEMLMAFVDGELDPATRNEIKVALRSDPELRARAAVFEATRRPIATVFDPILSQPLSEPQKNIHIKVGSEETLPHAPRDQQQQPAGIFRWFSGLFQLPSSLSVAAALGVVFLGGLGLGLLLKTGVAPNGSTNTTLVAVRDDGLVATGTLDRALKKFRSGSSLIESVAGGQELMIKLILSFRNNEGGVCREYEITYPTVRRIAGLACHTGGGNWNVLVQSPMKPGPANGSDAVVPSGGGVATIDAVVERIIKGDALSPDQEISLIENGWRTQD